MNALQRTLAILACLCLLVQTVRHAYVLWFERRESVLDKYDRPLKDEIASAKSLDDLVARYDPVRKEADRVKAEQRAADRKITFEDRQEAEPFKSEASLREAIQSWEERAKEIHGIHFCCLVGLILVAAGVASYSWVNRWMGMALLVTGFSELIYWTSPTFLGAVTKEFDRLLINKLVLTLLATALLVLTIRILGAFSDSKNRG